jgi:hypothetical protein
MITRLAAAAACALALAAVVSGEAAVPRAASAAEQFLDALRDIQQLAVGSRATLELGNGVGLARDALLPIRLPSGAHVTLQVAGGARHTLDVAEGQHLLIVPAGSSLTLHNLDIRVGLDGAPATQPPLHAVNGLPLWPAIQLEPGAALRLSSVSINLPATERCVPAAWQRLTLKLPVPAADAGPRILAAGGRDVQGLSTVCVPRAVLLSFTITAVSNHTLLSAASPQEARCL